MEKDVQAIDEAAKKPAEKAPEAKPAEHFEDCKNCNGTGLDDDNLCAVCGGSGRVLPSSAQG